MADLLSKSHLISSAWPASCSSSASYESHRRICVSGKNRSNRLNGLPLKAKSQVIRSHVVPFGAVGVHGKKPLQGNEGSRNRRGHLRRASVRAQLVSGRIGNVQKWWEKGLQSNMKEVTSAQDLVDSLLNAGDKLVIVDFFSPGCGGCKALHPKICQLAEGNPDVQFLHVNYEEHKSMCYSLNVHVLPFFRFYRGSQGRVCSFSCTNATIKKFRDALAKHSPDRCSIGPVKGLEEKELVALAANRELNFTYTQKKVHSKPTAPIGQEKDVPAVSPSTKWPSSPLPVPTTVVRHPQENEGKALVPSGR
ncbi:Thioredoxin-like 1-1, chloroplastic [Linum perenne]